MHRGYVKLWRKSFDSGLHKDPKTFLLWNYILCSVSHKEIDIIFNRKKVHLKAGEMATTLNRLAEPLFLSVQNIRTSLKYLEKYENLTSTSTNKYRIISVINWEIYQQTEILPNKQSNKYLTSTQQVPNKLLYNKQEHKNVKNNYSSDFEQFWAVYPKRIGKGAAYRSWLKIKPNNGILKIIINSIEKQKHCDQWKRDGGQFIPHPATWLNQSRWEDETHVKLEPSVKCLTQAEIDRKNA